jgi:transposase
MSGKRYTDEFKIAAVKQVTERGHAAHEVADRLGVSIYSMYSWIKRYSVPDEERIATDAQADEVRRLKAELKRVTDERDILKKAAVSSTELVLVPLVLRSVEKMLSAHLLYDFAGAYAGRPRRRT